MILDTMIGIKATAIDAIWALAHPTGDSAIPEEVRFLNQAIRGSWKTLFGHEIINVLATQAEIDAFVAAYTSDVGGVYTWEQGLQFLSLDNFKGDVNKVVDFMERHIDRDAEGNGTGTHAATASDPNWAHGFAGMNSRTIIFVPPPE